VLCSPSLQAESASALTSTSDRMRMTLPSV
jgi:hypothetical protein